MPRVIREGVEQAEQQRDGQHGDHQFGQAQRVVFGDVRGVEVVRLKGVEGGEEIEGDPKREEPAETINQRDQQLAQQVAIEETHPGAAYTARGGGCKRRAGSRRGLGGIRSG